MAMEQSFHGDVYAETSGVVGINSAMYLGSGVDPVSEWMCRYAAKLQPLVEPDFYVDGRTNDIWNGEPLQRCLNGTGQTVVLTGHLGIGKTSTVCGLIRRVQDMPKEAACPSVVAYMLFDAATDIDVSAMSVMMELLRQVVEQQPSDAKNKVLQLLKRRGSAEPSAGDLRKLMSDILADTPRACLVLDALDEFKGQSQMQVLLRELSQLQKATGIGIVMTDREFMRPGLKSFASVVVVRLEKHAQDVKDFVTKLLQHSENWTDFLVDNPGLVKRSVDKLSAASGSMFLLLLLNTTFVLSSLTEAKFEELLDAVHEPASFDRNFGADGILPLPVREAFDRNVERILQYSPSDRDYAFRILGYVAFSRRPLAMRALQHALAMNQSREDIADKDTVSARRVLSLSLGMLVTEYDRVKFAHRWALATEGYGRVKYAHRSLEAYVRAIQDDRFNVAKSDLGTACLRYLSMDVFSDGECSTEPALHYRSNKYPLMSYAARYWVQHFPWTHSTPGHGLRDLREVQDIVSKFFKNRHQTDAALQAFVFEEFRHGKNVHDSIYVENCSPKFSDLEMFSEDEGALSEDSWEDEGDLSSCKSTGNRNCLHYACHLREPGLVELSLAANVPLNVPDRRGRKPLHIAAMLVQAECASMLLNAGAEANAQDKRGRSPLFYVFEKGLREETFSTAQTMLGWPDVNVNALDEDGYTSLIHCLRCIWNWKPASLDWAKARRIFDLFWVRDDLDVSRMVPTASSCPLEVKEKVLSILLAREPRTPFLRDGQIAALANASIVLWPQNRHKEISPESLFIGPSLSVVFNKMWESNMTFEGKDQQELEAAGVFHFTREDAWCQLL